MSIHTLHFHSKTSSCARRDEDFPSELRLLLDSNELRLDRLDRLGVPVIVDGPALLLFMFQRLVDRNRSAVEAKLTWARNIAGLIDDYERGSFTDSLCA
jgi:hypothetical protein